ncbi:type VII secretion target [Nocardia testacea]|uniref:type VII secretion target n=1 Tax=Nocardia testacea TaxID=248551 RepID=UPI0002D3E006|nr:type VII secretion target [Nocardia testacea]
MVEVDPEKLRSAAQTLSLLSDEINTAPALGAEQVEGKLAGSEVGINLVASTEAARQARDALCTRFTQLSQLLNDSASTFGDSDIELAGKLSTISALLPDSGSDEN